MGAALPTQQQQPLVQGQPDAGPWAGASAWQQQEAAAAGGSGKGLKIAIKIGSVVGGLAVLGLLIWLVFKFTAGGGADTHEKIMDDMLAAHTEFATILNGVNTVDDAKIAKSDLDAVILRMEAVNERAGAMGKPDKDTQEKLKKKVLSGMGTMLSMMPKMMELENNPEIKAALGLEEIQSRMNASKMDWFDSPVELPLE